MPLHRKTPLQRKTPLRSHDTPLKRTPLKRTTRLSASGPLPPMSARRREVILVRRSFVVEYLTAHPRCMVRWDGGCTGWSIHVHEALTRARGGVIVPTEGRDQTFFGTCWWCHAMLHDHPEEATARGFLRSA